MDCADSFESRVWRIELGLTETWAFNVEASLKPILYHEGRNVCNLKSRAKILQSGSWIQDPGSWNQDPGSWGSFCVALGCLWDFFRRLRVPLGALGGVGGHFGPPWGGHVAETPCLSTKQGLRDHIPRIPRIPRIPPDQPEMVHRLQLGTSPTRAGGQDDVSLDKLPQNRSDEGLGGAIGN